MLGAEWKKLLFHRRGMLYLCLFLLGKAALLGLTVTPYNRAAEENRASYEAYLAQVEGPFTEEKAAFLEEEAQRITEAKEELEELRMQYYSGEVGKEEYEERAAALEAAKEGEWGFQEVFNQYMYIREGPKDRYFVSTNGWNGLLAGMEADYLGILLLLALVVPVFSDEYGSGMDQLLLTCKGSARRQVTAKLGAAAFTAMAAAVLGNVMEYAYYAFRFGLPDGAFPLQSLETYSGLEKSLTLMQAFLLQAAVRVFGYAYSAALLLFITSCCRKASVSLAVGTGVLLLPYLLTQNYHTLTRIPGPWGCLVGKGFLAGTQYETNLYSGVQTLVAAEPGWAEIGCLFAGMAAIIAAMWYIMRRQNRNQWV